MSLVIPSIFQVTDSEIQTIDANDIKERIDETTYALFRQAVDDIKVIRLQFLTLCATSFGKDSTVVLLAALQAHRELISEGRIAKDAPFIVSHIDTGVENHLISMVASYEMERLRAFCEMKSINLDLRVRKPDLARSWSSLFLSGLKIISGPKLNSDCSVILKVDNARVLEKQIEKEYGKENLVTLLGVRLDESVARKQKMKRSGSDIRDVKSLLDVGDDERVFAPIKSMSDSHIWTIIRAAGTSPIEKNSYYTYPSYGEHHRILYQVYKDSKGGACPTSSKSIKGGNESPGGCGASARTGCALCCKVKIDASATAQGLKPRHSVISGNIVKVRDYIITISQRLENRTFHSRAIHHPTGAIALQPNVLNAQTLDKLIWLLTQVTFDEQLRADQFASLVSKGKEMEDPGYRDILTDSDMDLEDRMEMAAMYKRYAVKPLLKPMSLDIAVYLSAIHARDGIRLPPYRAIAIWDKVSKGERIPYPNVDPNLAIEDEIPDAVMALPDKSISIDDYYSYSMLDDEYESSCHFDIKDNATSIKVEDARVILPETEREPLEALSSSGTVCIRHLHQVSSVKVLKESESKKRNIRHRGSRRSIKRVSRAGGKVRVLERGRTSVDSPSFGPRSCTSDLSQRFTTSVPVYSTTQAYRHVIDVDTDNELASSYSVNIENLMNWNDYDGATRAIDMHDEFVERKRKNGESIYFYGGIHPFLDFHRWGVITLTQAAKTHSERILQRTAYFQAIGLFTLDENQIVTLSSQTRSNLELKLNEIRDKSLSDNLSLRIDSIMPMTEFRAFFARQLLGLRLKRSQDRVETRQLCSLCSEDPVAYLVGRIDALWSEFKVEYEKALKHYRYSLILVKGKMVGFDGTDYRARMRLNAGLLRYMESFFNSCDYLRLLKLLPRHLKQLVCQDIVGMTTIQNAAMKVVDDMNKLRAGTNLCAPFGMYQMLMEFKGIKGDHVLLCRLTPKTLTNNLKKSVFKSKIAFN